MKREKTRKYLRYWLQARRGSISLYIVLMTCYLIVAILSHIPFEPILYSTYLFCFIGIIVSLFDFFKYIKKHQALQNVCQNSKVSLENLPFPKDLLEEDYQELAKQLYSEQQAIRLQAKRQASEMNDYYTLWAHQIKIPISAMHLLFQEEGFEEKNYVLERELFKIEQYVEMVLQYLRLESISSDLVLKSYSLYDIVKQVVKKYATYFIGEKISLEFEPSDAKVITDEKWMSFVIEQIISNSLKYTKQGKISIYVKDKALIISDTGIGIRSEDLPRIFERGFTGYNGRMDKKSTGIGLYLCKQITSRLSHSLEVTSKVGEGTSVRIDFKADDKPYQNVTLPKEM